MIVYALKKDTGWRCPGIFLIVFVFAGLPMRAQVSSPGRALSINDAVSLALRNYPSIRAREAQVRSGMAAVTETRDRRLPSLNLFEQVDAGTSNNLGAAYFSGGIVPSVSGVSARPENIGTVSSGNIGVAYLQWQASNFGGYKAGIQEAYSRLKVDTMDLGRERFYIASIVLQSYLDLIRNYELSLIQWENLRRADTIRMAIRNYVISGLRPGVDSSLAEAEYSKARLNYMDVYNAFRQSKVQLSLLTALDTAAISPDQGNDSLLLGSLNVAGYKDTARSGHPFLTYFHSIYENSQARERLIRKSYLPKLYVLAAGWMKGSSIQPDGTINKDLGSGLGYSRYNYLFGLGITYDLFDLRRQKDRLNVQRYQTEVALHNYEQQEQTLTNASLQASVNLTTAIEKFNEIPVQLNAARDAYNQRLTQYNAGLSNIIDVTNALYVLNRAQTDVVNTKDGVWRAIVQKAYAKGDIYQLLSTLK
ncbi:TolC family protein [Flavitalea sp. BT771]|uniref:TolC family protein n=1 Tax=Flavitalea sp. BT771 TaxID=3063329 RepID=UPI0026E27D2B|nr:TolC family protein [Flavitalea sp. BT771]MDO6434033.1 TolC family protein [Flavitalea sp. BT771]MDV6222933.1 TolC family protein [Flavitalea sp. BT771]